MTSKQIWIALGLLSVSGAIYIAKVIKDVIAEDAKKEEVPNTTMHYYYNQDGFLCISGLEVKSEV